MRFAAIVIITIASIPSYGADALNELLKKYGAPAEAREVKPAPPAETGGGRDPASSTRAKPAKVKKKKTPVEPVAPTAPAPPVEAAPVPQPPGEDAAEEGLFGDWGGAKSKAKEAGVDLALYYKGTTMSIMSGGLKRGTHYFGNVDVTADFDFEKLAGAKGLSLSLYGLGNHGGSPSEYVGNFQGVDNIEAPSTFKLYEAYLQQQVDDRFIVQLGLRDFNADYFSTESSKPFLNPTFGIGGIMAQTGPNGPSIFPTTALALNTKYQSPSDFYFQAAVFNAQAGDPDKPYGTQVTLNHDAGHMLVSEMGWAGERDDAPFKTAIGAWKYTVADAAQDSSKADAQSYGFYVLLDHELAKGLNGFIRYGTAENTVNVISQGVDFGLSFKGLIPSRSEDVFGLAAAFAQFTDGYKVAQAVDGVTISKDEWVIETLYRLQFPRGIIVQPGVQYVIHPGGVDGVKDAWVGAARIEINF